jgi:DNA-binding MarR family transcriptional regulator
VESFDSQSIDGDQLTGLVSALIRAEHRHAAFLARHLKLPAADTLALYHLANEPLRSRELADRLGLTPGSVTSLVDRLIARGLASRVSDERDRRVVLVELTAQARETTWQALRHFITEVMRLSSAQDAASQQAITAFLTELITATDRDTERLQAREPS